MSLFDGVNYRGTFTDMSSMSTADKTTLEANGHSRCIRYIRCIKPPARNASVDADLQDAINDGVIIISSAGNSYMEL